MAMQLDITMMTMLNATERTLTHWKSLLGEVGLNITKVYEYDVYGEDSVLEVVPIETESRQDQREDFLVDRAVVGLCFLL
jgi:hypothetical protein